MDILVLRISILLLLLCSNVRLDSQTRDAEKAERLLDRAYAFAYANLDSCQHYAWRALDLAKSANDDWLLARTYELVGDNFVEIYQNDSVLHYYRQAENLYAQSDRQDARVRSLRLASAIARTVGRDANSLKLSLEWAEECKRLNDEQCLADAYWDAGSAFFFQDQQEEAADYSRRALELMAKSDDRLGYANCLIGHSESQRLQGDYNGASTSLRQARTIIADEEVPLLSAELHLNEGKNYMAQDSLELAEETLRQGLPYADRSGARVNKAMLLGTIGRVALRQENYEKAIHFLKHELAAVAHFSNASRYSTDYQLSLSQAFAAQHRFDSAYFYLSLAERNYREYVHDDYDEQLSELQVSYETAEKENQIDLQLAQLQRQRMQLYATGTGIFLLLLVVIIFIVFSRKLSLQNKKNKRLVQEKETLIGEIHHRVKNNLQVIASLLQLQRRRLPAEDHHAHGVLLESQSRVEAMGLIHQKLYLGEDLTSVKMPEYLEELGEALLDAYRLNDHVELFFDVEPITLDVTVAISLGLIVNELITNSLKHAFPDGRQGTIEITLYRETQGLVLRVCDDGVGQSAAGPRKSSTSFGTELIVLLSKKLRGVTRRLKVKGYGTEIRFALQPADSRQ